MRILCLAVAALAMACSTLPQPAGAPVQGPDRARGSPDPAALSDSCGLLVLLGRPSDTSVTLNIVSRAAADVRAEYGPAGWPLKASTATVQADGGKPVNLEITGLEPNTAYAYRLRLVPLGEGGGADSRGVDSGRAETMAGGFHTQRARGAAFTFTVQADAHLSSSVAEKREERLLIYERTLENVLRDSPDFHIDLGDFARIEIRGGKSARSIVEAAERYMSQRCFLRPIGPSVPFYLVLGNHEGEQGWRSVAQDDSLEIWATLARKALIPNPHPDGFYSGNADPEACCGLLEDYYAWEWGDALFVVLDPFRYTTIRPQQVVGQSAASLDGWDWTLGLAQYNWLYATLHNSRARWKFVFAHHMTGGVIGAKGEGYYGRGGIDAARHAVAGRPSFEWAGEDSLGNFVFAEKRPGWEHGPIHQMMVDQGVSIFFRGHDHAFVREELDGIVYQTCPDPADFRYTSGYYSPYYFSSARAVNNPGHLRVTVTSDSVRVDYVRSVLPEDEPLREEGRTVRNGDMSYSYTLTK